VLFETWLAHSEGIIRRAAIRTGWTFCSRTATRYGSIYVDYERLGESFREELRVRLADHVGRPWFTADVNRLGSSKHSYQGTKRIRPGPLSERPQVYATTSCQISGGWTGRSAGLPRTTGVRDARGSDRRGLPPWGETLLAAGQGGGRCPVLVP